MSEIRAWLVDDEAPARLRLRELLKDFADVLVCGESEHGRKALSDIAEHKPDAVFLDIRMPGIDGLEVARTLAQTEDAPLVVFCTAYDDQALAAFDAKAVDYLLKPISRERMANALMRLRRILGKETQRNSVTTPKRARRTHFSVKARGQLKLVALNDVAYLHADTKYVELHTGAETFLLEESLVQLEEEFGEHFLRIHRSCLVTRQHVLGLARLPSGETQIRVRLPMGNPTREIGLDVSRRNLPQVRKVLLEL
jgi:two-component system, LytTR family, response regulator AlgR